MTQSTIAWPVKMREMHNHHMNSGVWNHFKFREGDVVIDTWGKSGTTWTQQIVSQLIHGGAENIDIHGLSPWIDLRIMPPEAIASVEAQTGRRFVKSHLPVNALVFSPKAKYIYIGRDGRDAVWSFYNHHVNANDAWFGALNDTPGRVGPAIEPVNQPVDEYFRTWLARDGYPLWPFWEHVRSWWGVRALPNVLLVHFADMKADLPGSIQRIAAFIDIKLDATDLAKITEHCGFDYMKAHATHLAPMGGMFWNGGAETFINKGTNGRWRDILTADDNAAYEQKAVAELGAECAAWLAGGAKA